MWGRKKTKNTQTQQKNTPGTDTFAIHTMQDDIESSAHDIDDILQDNIQKTSSQKPATTNNTPSPFDIEHAQSPFVPQEEDTPAQNPFAVSPEAPTPPAENMRVTQHTQDIPPEKQQPLERQMTKEKVSITPPDVPQPDARIHIVQEKQVEHTYADAPSEAPNFTGKTLSQSPFGNDDGDVTYNESTVVDHQSKATVQRGASRTVLRVMIVVVAIVLVVGAAFAWYWWQQRSTVSSDVLDDTVITTDPMVDNPVKEDVPDSIPESMTYSQDLPNYITIGDDITAATDFAQQLATIDRTIQEEDVTGPLTFLVVNKEQDVLSLRAFAQLVGMTLTEAILATLGDQFEIYAYHDVAIGYTYFGLAADIRDRQALEAALFAGEKALQEQLTPLFIGLAPQNVTPLFADGIYHIHAIRYMNFENDFAQSIDYTLIDGRFLLATSKETMHALIDRLFGNGLVENVDVVEPSIIDNATGEIF